MKAVVHSLMGWVAALVCVAAGPPEPVPAAPAEQAFRTLATVRAQEVRICLDAAGSAIDDNARDDLVRRLDAFDKNVEARIDTHRKSGGHAMEFLAQSGDLAEQFDPDVLEPWKTAHPTAHAALQRMDSVLNGGYFALGDKQAELMKAAEAAGLRPDDRANVKAIIDEAYAREVEFGKQIQARQ